MRISKRWLMVAFLFCLLSVSACSSAPQSTKVLATPRPSPTLRPSPTSVLSPTPVPISGLVHTGSTPVRLLIPAIGVNASVEDLGLTSTGDLATPTKSPWEDVGWYRNGSYPGEQGSAVIDGHLDRPGGYPAVFWNLRYLQAGDSVMVFDARGKTWTFRVLLVASYAPNQAPLQEIFDMTGGVYLNLITCTGTWIPAQHQTTLRLVVYTILT